MKKVIAFALVLLMIVPLMVFSASADTITPDTSWYDAGKTEFTISTAAQLYGFASLSQSNDFAGKTVKLDKDITVNEGDASTWATTAPAYSWTPISGFAGTFDGQGHTVSGLYYNGSSKAGMFASLVSGAVITDFRLVNTYIKTGNGNVQTGGVVGSSAGATISYIYSDAIVVAGDHHAGGILALCSGGETTVEYCWFDGSVTIGARYAAGIVGNGNGAKVTVKHCLNTGSIYTTQTAAGNSHIAGIVGRNDARTLIEDCLNVGKISSAWLEANGSDQIGSIFGGCNANNKNDDGTWASHVDILSSWASAESCLNVVGLNGSKDPDQEKDYKAIPEVLLKGYGGYLNTTLDFENVWAVDLNGSPVLQYFADSVPELYDVNIPEITGTEVKAEGHYGPRWELTLKVPEGIKKDEIKVGMLIVPTKAIPVGLDMTLLDTSFTYRDDEYEVANVEGAILRESDDDTIIATFVVTDLSAANARMSFTAVPYAIYQVEGGTLELYGAAEKMVFYKEAVLSLEDDSVDAVTKAYTEQVLAPIDAEMGGRFPVSADWSERDLFEEIPAMVVADTEILPEEDKGLGNYVITVDGTLDSDYYAYLETMETFGFEKVYDNSASDLATTADAVYTTIYQKGDLFVTVTDLGYINKCYVSAMYDMAISEHLFDNFKDDVLPGKQTTLSMKELYWWGNSIIFQLKNNHFIINDGATNYELGYLLDYLESLVPAGEKPVVEGWFVSHYHMDHIYLLSQFNSNPTWSDRVIVEGFYSSWPSNGVCDLDTGVYNEMARELEAIARLKDSDGNIPTMYRVQTGQTLYFSDIEVDIMLTQEQIPLANYKGGFNDSSTWLQYRIGDQNVVIAGDSHQAGMGMILDIYESDYLDFDVWFALHHGYNTWDTFTNATTYHTVMFPARTFYGSTPNVNLRDKALANGGEYFVDGNGTVVLTFPYTVGSARTLPNTDWIYHKGQERPFMI